MTVVARKRAGSCTVRVLQYGGTATKNEVQTKIAQLNVNPATEVTQLFGVQGGAWGLVHVGTDGAVSIYHMFNASALTWSLIDVSVTFTIA